jgi:hypothetical protein
MSNAHYRCLMIGSITIGGCTHLDCDKRPAEKTYAAAVIIMSPLTITSAAMRHLANVCHVSSHDFTNPTAAADRTTAVCAPHPPLPTSNRPVMSDHLRSSCWNWSWRPPRRAGSISLARSRPAARNCLHSAAAAVGCCVHGAWLLWCMDAQVLWEQACVSKGNSDACLACLALMVLPSVIS